MSYPGAPPSPVNAKSITFVIAVLLVGAFGAFYECAAYDECRRVHPEWYCLTR